MRCCTGCGRAAPGGCCPMTCRPGRPSTTTSAPGRRKGGGNRSCECCVAKSVYGRAGGQPPAPPSWTAEQPVAQSSGGYVGLFWRGNSLDVAGRLWECRCHDRSSRPPDPDRAVRRPGLGRADAAAAGLDGQIAMVQADLEALPVTDGACDLVWCRDVLSCVGDAGRMLRECARVLRPGGGMVNRSRRSRVVGGSCAGAWGLCG
jgi:Methyltransferase domain